METGEPAAPEPFSLQAQITKRLVGLGVPRDYADHSRLVEYVKDNAVDMLQLITAIFPSAEDAEEALSRINWDAVRRGITLDLFVESMVWVEWLLFNGDPGSALEELLQLSSGDRGICPTVWKRKDIAYRCNTCGLDPGCYICIPCFRTTDHTGHDYSTITVYGGCCDCGDVTALKQSGFCLKHKGTEHMQPLPSKLSNSMGPVLDQLFCFWHNKLAPFQGVPWYSSKHDDNSLDAREELTCVLAELFVRLCRKSESILSYIAYKMSSLHGLMENLVRVEQLFFNGYFVEKLHELLLLLLGEAQFRYEFAKVFLGYYPTVVAEALEKSSNGRLKEFPQLKTFSVQIFPVPTLTLRLVKEMNILPVLLECLESIFISCIGDDGRLKVKKLGKLYEITIRVAEDIQYVMSHSAVSSYISHERQDIIRTWMRTLSFVQGMNLYPLHIEEENDVKSPFFLGYLLVKVHSYLVDAAFSDASSEEVEYDSGCTTFRQELTEPDLRLSQESSGRNLIYHTSTVAEAMRDFISIPSSVSWLTFECLRTIDSWLLLDNSFSRLSSSSSSGEVLGRQRQSSIPSCHSKVSLDSGQYLGQEAGSSGADEISTETECSTAPESLKVLSLSEWPEIVYDMISQGVSVHIPYHRLLSMVLQSSLRKCYGEEFPPCILGGCHPHGLSACLLEHPLRIRVFFAQVRAGLWSGNGNVSSTYYHSARSSEKGLELDLFLLQCCAALAPPDLYVKRILERYSICEYLNLNLEWSIEHESILVQEMLTLIIQIVKERRFCGLTSTECLRRELVYKLSTGDATHSQLVKSVPEDLSNIADLQQILDSVAEYSKPSSNPSGLNQGMYKLRLECWKELDLYHPRFNSRDLQIAKERYLRFCNISAVTAQLPNWSKIYQPLRGIARIATCKTILQIVRAVLFYSVFSAESMTSRAPEGVLITAMHMLSLALNICSLQRASGQSLSHIGDTIPLLEFASEEISSSRHTGQSLLSLLDMLHEKEKNESSSNIASLCDKILNKFTEFGLKCSIKMQKIAPEIVNQLSESSSNIDGLTFDSEKLKAEARERQAAVLENMRLQQSQFLESIKFTVGQEADVSECAEDLVDNEVLHDSEDLEEIACSLCHDTNSRSPVCFLIHLQKSRLVSFLDRGSVSWECSSLSKGESTGKSAISTPLLISNVSDSSHLELAHLVQCAVNSVASDCQPHEINAFFGFINFHFPSVRNIDCPLISEDVSVTTSSIENLEEHIYSLVQENLHQTVLQKDFQKYGGDFCFPGGNLERSSQSLLLGKYIASIAKEMTNSPSGSENLHIPQNEAHAGTSLRTHTYDSFDGIYLSSCGHAVHQSCLERYLLSLRDRYARRITFEGSHIVDPDKGEFLCPVCRGLANSALPTLPRDSEKVPRAPVSPNIHASDSGIFSALTSREVNSLRIQEAVRLMKSASFIAGDKELIKLIPLQQSERQRSNLDSLFCDLCSLCFPSTGNIIESGRVSLSLLLWDMLEYTIASTEVAARSEKKRTAPAPASDPLHDELKSSSGFALSLLLNIVQGSRTKNMPTTFLRFRGIQLFAESLCLGSSNLERNCQEGNLLCLLETSESLDTRFWKTASNPVLSQNSFSSFMRVLFCLPTPFLSCKESFFCLVHIFYLVTITQSIVTCCRKRRCSVTELGLMDCLITDICKIIKENEIPLQYFDSNCTDSCYDIKDAIRSLSSPFLRRCSFLWGLVRSSASFPFSHGNHRSDGSSYMPPDTVKHQSHVVDLVEVERLELMFKIPPIDMVINDSMSRSMATRWLHHFSKEFKPQGQNVLYCTPSVPFSLMVLPKLYDDLFVRYIDKQSCPECRRVLEEPALCLLCGKLCAPNWKTCCREGGCQIHAMACGAGTGVFLLIRSTSILLQRAARQALWPSLYLDAFGEEGSYMVQGRPLYLNEERYAVLNYMVASHGLDRSSSVLDRTTVNI